jgi:hypothetical protein
MRDGGLRPPCRRDRSVSRRAGKQSRRTFPAAAGGHCFAGWAPPVQRHCVTVTNLVGRVGPNYAVRQHPPTNTGKAAYSIPPYLAAGAGGRGSARFDGWQSCGSARGAELAAAASAALCCRSESGARSGDWRRWVVVLSCADEIDLHPCSDSPSPSQRFENPLDGAGWGNGKAHSSFDNPDGRSCANRRPVASNPGSRLSATARLPERGVVGSGRKRVSPAGGAGAAGLSERRLVGSGRQCVQAAASAVPAELRGRTVLESGFQRLSAAWPGLGG